MLEYYTWHVSDKKPRSTAWSALSIKYTKASSWRRHLFQVPKVRSVLLLSAAIHALFEANPLVILNFCNHYYLNDLNQKPVREPVNFKN